MKQSIVSTVGISLLVNLKRAGPECELAALYERDDFARLGRQLREEAPDALICGAEINSIHQLLGRQQFADVHRLDFCVSETAEGRAIGEILKAYYHDFRVAIHVIEELSDQNPERFRVYGLRNLARKLGHLVRSAGSPDYVALNCTGGYKAQVAIAVLIGQTIGVEVFYKHERFPSIIAFPAMPVSFDYSILAENADILNRLENGEEISCPEETIPWSLRPLLEEMEVDGQFLWALAPIGQIYFEGYRKAYPPDKCMPRDADQSERKPPTFGNDHHYPSGFKSYVHKVWKQSPYILTGHTLPYGDQAGIGTRGFRLAPEERYVVCDYKSDFGARMAIYTTASSLGERLAVTMDLNQRFAD